MCLALSLLCWWVQRTLVSGGWSQEEAAEMDMDSRAPRWAEHTLTTPFWQRAHPSANETGMGRQWGLSLNPPLSPQTISQTRRPARAVFSRLCSLLSWQLSWGYTTCYFSATEVRTKLFTKQLKTYCGRSELGWQTRLTQCNVSGQRDKDLKYLTINGFLLLQCILLLKEHLLNLLL